MGKEGVDQAQHYLRTLSSPELGAGRKGSPEAASDSATSSSSRANTCFQEESLPEEKGVPWKGREGEVKGQLGTQVKDASLSELGNPSLDREASRGRERKGRASRPSRTQEGRTSSRPGSSITCAWQMQPRGRAGPGWPAGDLPAHRLVGQLAHAVKLLLHRGPAAALARELGKDGAARSPPQGYMAPAPSLPGDDGGTAEPGEPPGPRPASREHLRLVRQLHPSLCHARGRPRRPAVSPGCSPPAPARRANRGVSAGWLASWPGGPRAPVRNAPCMLGLVVCRSHLSSVQSL